MWNTGGYLKHWVFVWNTGGCKTLGFILRSSRFHRIDDLQLKIVKRWAMLRGSSSKIGLKGYDPSRSSFYAVRNSCPARARIHPPLGPALLHHHLRPEKPADLRHSARQKRGGPRNIPKQTQGRGAAEGRLHRSLQLLSQPHPSLLSQRPHRGRSLTCRACGEQPHKRKYP